MEAIIVGGGPAGLAAALFAARKGHDVVLLEPDSAPPGPDAEHDFSAWPRRGVAQARQGHVFLARSSRVLREEAPDVLAALFARGAVESPLEADAKACNVLCRRLVYEAVLRRAVQSESRVHVLESRVDGLLVDRRSVMPRVAGVRTALMGELRADVVVDATGRRSKVPEWLAAHGASRPQEFLQPCGFFYVSRHYRLKSGESFPSTAIPIVAPLDYLTVLAFPADNRCYQLSLTVSVDDPHRRRLLNPDTFDRILSVLPIGETWLSRGVALDDPKPMADIANRRRSLLIEGAPVVAGLVLLGDSSLQTNPTTGRGISLAFAQAQYFAQALARADDAVAFVRDYETWTEQQLGIWFASQIAIDEVRNAQLAASVRGQGFRPPQDGMNRWIAGLAVLSKEDQAVHSAVQRLYNLLITPKELMADHQISRKVLAFLRRHPVLDIRPPGLTRAAFEQAVTA